MKYLMKLNCFTESKTYIKAFENIKNNPEIGDYVICEEGFLDNIEIKDFISNNIGQIIGIEVPNYFTIQYENVPKEFKWYFHPIDYRDITNMRLDEIILFSKNKEELEDYLITKKYNL